LFLKIDLAPQSSVLVLKVLQSELDLAILFLKRIDLFGQVVDHIRDAINGVFRDLSVFKKALSVENLSLLHQERPSIMLRIALLTTLGPLASTFGVLVSRGPIWPGSVAIPVIAVLTCVVAHVVTVWGCGREITGRHRRLRK
jgi:hypothetical protein